jgi:lambda family phage portal protein
MWRPDSAHMAASLRSRELAGWDPVAGSADSDLLPDLGTLRPRSRDLSRNHGIASGAHQTLVDNIVGTGLRLVSMPDYRALGKDKKWAEAWSTDVESKWRAFAETTDCDAAGQLNFYGLTRQVFMGGMLNGESLAIPLWLPGRGKYSTKMQIVEADRLSTPWGQIDGPTMRGGVEIDQYGRPVAYNVRNIHPGDIYLSFMPNAFLWERIPAETPWGRKRVIHVHDKERTGQSRGKPILTPVLTQFKMLDHYQRTEIQAAVVNAMLAAFIETPMDSASIAEMLGADPNAKQWQDVQTARNEYMAPLAGGAVIPVFPGDKVTAFTPARPAAAFGPFTEAVLRHIGAGIGLPYELLVKDFSKTNYSSARAAMLEAWRFFTGRREWLSTLFCTPVFGLWLEEAINAGQIEAPDFYEHQYAYTRCRWNGPGRGWVDPVKEATAAQIRMANNLSTLEKECSEQGMEWEEVLEQRAAERARMIELGLPDPFILESKQPLQLQQVEDEDEDPEEPPAAPDKETKPQ